MPHLLHLLIVDVLKHRPFENISNDAQLGVQNVENVVHDRQVMGLGVVPKCRMFTLLLAVTMYSSSPV
jgi:hypothetical protein